MTRRVTYKKWFGALMLACSLFILGTSLFIGVSLNTITGLILAVISILYLVNPALEYTDDELRIKNLYGMTMKTVSFRTDRVEIREGRIYANDKKLSVAKGMLNSDEMYALYDHIGKLNGQ